MSREWLDGAEMGREWLLAGVLVAVVVVTVALSVLVPGAIADRAEPEPDTAPDGRLTLEEISISDGRVGGETLDLAADVRLEHTGGETENASVELRAVALDSGLVVDSQRVALEPLSEDRELSVTDTLTVDRGGDYRIEALVYQEGRRTTVGEKEVRGTDALSPDYADSPVTFHRFVRHPLPVVEYSVADAGTNRSTLSVSTHLTNAGESTARDLEVVFKARQVDSGIVADEQSVRIDTIGPGETVTPETELTVPDQYNYHLDAVLWEEGVLLETARSGASLDPTETVPVNQTERSVELDVGDFESEQEETPAPMATETPEAAADDGGPGFGVLTALLALVAGLIVAARNRTRGD